MKITLLFCTIMTVLLSPQLVDAGDNIFFLHNSVGRYVIDYGSVRDHIDSSNAMNGTELELWDHDYNHIGLTNPAGEIVGGYNIPNDDTDPGGLHYLWTSSNSAKDAILANHDVIVFKSCYSASQITSNAELQQFKEYYYDIVEVLETHSDKTFLLMSPPPRHRLGTSSNDSRRAREFADWMGSSELLSGATNVHYFDMFDFLAHPDDGSPASNMLKYEYEKFHDSYDSHPNLIANQALGIVLAGELIDISNNALQENYETSWGATKALFK
ncbi:MAG: hypothetical protein GY893_08895 [bacterium]|nr:hypothetical protein [bacterium]